VDAAVNPKRETGSWSNSVGFFVGGLVVGILFNFLLNLVIGPAFSSSSLNPITILVVWLATAGVFWLMRRANPWAGWGMLGAYAALFLMLLTAGMFGPSTCFGIYGYPHS
jgi:hypothetical protein